MCSYFNVVASKLSIASGLKEGMVKMSQNPNLFLTMIPILSCLAQIWAAKSFFQNLALSVTRYHGQLSSCTKSEESNDPILRKFSDDRTDGRTDGQTDESDFIRR